MKVSVYVYVAACTFYSRTYVRLLLLFGVLCYTVVRRGVESILVYTICTSDYQ